MKVEKFGEEYQKLRKSKGITQTDIAGDGMYISRGHLSRIENAQAIPNLEMADYMLRKIHVSYDEFAYLTNDYQLLEREAILHEFHSLVSYIEMERILNLKLRADFYLNVHQDPKVREIVNILNAFIYLSQKEHQKAHHLLETIWKRLAKVDTWTLDDLKIIHQIFYQFPTSTVLELYPRLKKTLIKYKDYANIHELKLSLALKSSYVFLRHDMLQEAQAILLENLELAKRLKRYDYLATIWVRLGICQHSKKKIDKGLALLEMAGEEKMIEFLKKEIAEFTMVKTV